LTANQSIKTVPITAINCVAADARLNVRNQRRRVRAFGQIFRMPMRLFCLLRALRMTVVAARWRKTKRGLLLRRAICMINASNIYFLTIPGLSCFFCQRDATSALFH
jgi:hypothetical protein